MTESEKTASHIPQVAKQAKHKQMLGMLAFSVVIILLLCSVILAGKKSSPKTIASNIKPNWNVTELPTQAVSANPANDALQTQVKEIQNKLALEKLAEAEKLYHLRQNAPIEMFKASGNDMQRIAPLAANTVTNNGDYSTQHLPLSASQIERLKSYNNNLDPNDQFQQQIANAASETNIATIMPHGDFVIPQGTLISGVLQTAINSDLPGMVKANVSQDVYAAQGDKVLIPQGSTLIGQYNSAVAMGQQRVFVVWSRIIRPDGISVQLSAPCTDTLGEAGLTADSKNTHFLARFGQASLLSIISAGISNVGANTPDSYNSASAYRLAISGSFQQSAGSSLLNTINIKPTLQVHQGDAISVFVNRDISFFEALAHAE